MDTDFAVVELTVNGIGHRVGVEPRRLLVDVLREDLGLTGTNIGCGQGVCGSCTVLVDGASARSCLMLAVQAHGADVVTVEGMATAAGVHPVQQAFLGRAGASSAGSARPASSPPRWSCSTATPKPIGGRDPRRAGGQHLPLHGLPAHRRRGGAGERRPRHEHATAEHSTAWVGARPPAARRTRRWCAGRSPTSTTCACPACCTPRCCARRTRTPGSSRSTPRPRGRCPVCTPC